MASGNVKPVCAPSFLASLVAPVSPLEMVGHALRPKSSLSMVIFFGKFKYVLIAPEIMDLHKPRFAGCNFWQEKIIFNPSFPLYLLYHVLDLHQADYSDHDVERALYFYGILPTSVIYKCLGHCDIIFAKECICSDQVDKVSHVPGQGLVRKAMGRVYSFCHHSSHALESCPKAWCNKCRNYGHFTLGYKILKCWMPVKWRVPISMPAPSYDSYSDNVQDSPLGA